LGLLCPAELNGLHCPLAEPSYRQSPGSLESAQLELLAAFLAPVRGEASSSGIL